MNAILGAKHNVHTGGDASAEKPHTLDNDIFIEPVDVDSVEPSYRPRSQYLAES
jgi:hypothetical protein